MTIIEFLGAMVANYGSFGIVTWLSSAIFIEWKKRNGGVEPTNDQKRIVSVLTAVVIVAAAYFAGVLLKAWPLDADALFKALQPIAIELAGSKVIFTVTKAVENKKKIAP